MPRKTNARVVLNRSKLNDVGLAVAEGLEAAAEAIVTDADPPDAPPFGEGLKQRGGWLSYHGSKKVGGGSLSGKQPKKPRAFRPAAGDLTAIAGFGFPGKFQELGTVHHSAQPFLWPAFLRNEGSIPRLMKPAVQARLRRSG